MGKGSLARIGWFMASLVLFVAIWAVVADLLHSRVLPGPVAVFQVLIEGLASGEIIYHTGITLARVAVSFVIAMIIGSAIGLALGRGPVLDKFFDPWLILFLNIPALVTIVLCYVWFGLTEAAAVLAVAINKIPNVAVTIREGARALNPDLTEMAAVYRLDRSTTLRQVILPQLAPFFAASARSGLALVWKIVLVVELMGRSDGVGFQLNLFFQLFDVKGIFAYTIAFIVVVQAIELFLLQPLERRVNRWRR